MRWAGYEARMGDIRTASKMWSENLKERDHSEELGVDRKNYVRLYLRGSRCEILDLMHLTQDRDEWRVPIKGGKFLH
jgi:hypothetical protein